MSKFQIKNRRYLGSKAKLLDFIKETVNRECGEIATFVDLFAGTGNVAWAFNDDKTSVTVNDLLESNYITYVAFFGGEKVDEAKIKKIIDSYNDVQVDSDNYFSSNFADTFFSKQNCRKIGFIREDIETLYSKKNINQRERAILITSLLYAMDKIANTVGHYDAFRMNGDLDKKLLLEELDIPNDKTNSNNHIFREDSNELVKKISADIIYIDPPYNSRQYCDAYHLLENVAQWKKPKVYGTARKMDRNGLKSKYCTRSAPLEFDRLVQDINAKFIIVSYNNMGAKGAGRSQAKISDEDIIGSLSRKGKVSVFEIDHAQFTTGKSNIENHKERLFVCKVGINDKPQEIKKDNSELVKSPLNYTGGKFKLLTQLFEKFPKSFSTFIDLFGGGFNVGANVTAKEVVYNDKNEKVKRIIKLFSKYSGTSIINKLENIIDSYHLSNSVLNGYDFYGCSSGNGLGNYNKSRYLELRNDYNSTKEQSEEKDFMLLCLIIYGFNNQIRFNASGEFNMPVGKRDLNLSVRSNIKDFSSKLKGMNLKFYSKSFETINPLKFEKPFFYCDPPYYLGTAAYNENDEWTENDEIKLLSFLKKLDDLNIPFALSNVIEHKGQTHTMLKKWADENYFNIIYLKADYSNSNYHLKAKNQVTKEVLITNY